MPPMRSDMALVLGLLFAACNGGPDQSSPRGVAEGLASAMDRGQADSALALLAPEAKVREAFDCGAGDALVRAIERERDDLRASFEELRQTGVRVRLARFDEKGSESQTVAAGETWRDCAARRPVEVHRARLTLVYRKGARDDDDGERWDFVKLPPDDLWWYLPR